MQFVSFTMTHSCQSASTLTQMLREAAVRVACAKTSSARSLSSRIDQLQRSIREDSAVSSQEEQEIVSLYVLAELEGARARRS
jgi:hypothetical protein